MRIPPDSTVPDAAQTDESPAWDKAFLEALLNASPDGITVLDAREKRVFQNQRAVELWGIPQDAVDRHDDEAQARHIQGMVKDSVRSRATIQYLLSHPDESARDEIDLLDGRVFDRYSSPVLGKDGTYLGRIWMVREVTERRLTESALRESENKFHDLVEKSIVGIYLIQHGVFKYVNAHFSEICGYSVEELTGLKGPADVVFPGDLPQLFAAASVGRLKEAGFIRDEFRVVRKAGEVRHVEICGSLTTYEGHPAIIGTLVDVTERNTAAQMLHELMTELESKNQELEKAYDELKESQKKIIQQEKMASIGQLAAGVAHEINNPMSFITSNLDSLQDYMSKIPKFVGIQAEAIESLTCGDKEAGEVVNSVAESRKTLKIDYLLRDCQDLIVESLEGAHRVKRIVLDLKNFSRMDETEHALADINKVLDSTINIAWNELKHKATLKKEYGGIPLTLCNAGQLGQVFMNILVNASQAMTDFGEIGVRTWCEEPYVRVEITDSGCGIPEDKLGRIFEPFFTTKEIGKGTGLGLSIAYDIVKKHKGEIEVKTELGKGTTFVVSLPIETNRVQEA